MSQGPIKKHQDYFSKMAAGDKSKPMHPVPREILKEIKTTDKNWTTGDLWLYRATRSGREVERCNKYYAVYRGQDVWRVVRVACPLKGEAYVESELLSTKSLPEALRELIRLEGALSSSLPRIEGGKGNYREVAVWAGLGALDKKGGLVLFETGKALTEEALMNRVRLDSLFDKGKKQAPISTWDDFYREIVNQVSLSGVPADEAVTQEERQDLEKFREEVKGISLPASQRNAIHITTFSNPSSDPVAYHYNLAILVSVIQVGADFFSKFAASSASIDTTSLQIVRDIGKRIKVYAEEYMGFTPERSQQLADLITKGPDPHAGKPLPIDALLKKGPLPGQKPKPYSP